MTHPQPEKNNFKEIDVSNLDAITWLRTIESNSVDLVITDPPYESLESIENWHDYPPQE